MGRSVSKTHEHAFKRLHDLLIGTENYELSDETVLMLHASVRIERLQAIVDRFVTTEQIEQFTKEAKT